MKYERYVHIILRDDKIKAVLTSASAARQALKDMRDNAMPPYEPDANFAEYLRACMIEEQKWHLVKRAVRKTMST